MASEQHDTVFPEEDQELEDDEESSEEDDLEENEDVLPEEEEEDDDEDLNSNSVTPAPAITVAFSSTSAVAVTASAASTAASASAVTVAVPPSAGCEEPDPKRQRVSVLEEKKPLPQQLDESRRLFQRLWTDEDEIELLQGFLDYTSQRGNTHHHDTALFYDQIRSKLQLDFNKNQLVEKLRRLKKKYRNVLSKISSGKDFSFKTAHDQATFEISRKIWSSNNNNTPNVSVLEDEDANHNNNLVNFSNEVKINNHNNSSIVVHSNNNHHEEKATPRSRKRSRSKAGASENVVLMNNSENANTNNVGGGGGWNSNNGIAGLVEETVRSCLSPLFKELLSNVMGGVGGRGIGGLAMNGVMPLGFGGAGLGFGGCGGGEVVDEKWRKQQILELEVYSKRLELVQDQIKVALEELRSMSG
ncbi:hypothetical protein JRO89_XS04G0172500 [Xanthoceras sorbifolium]|uniref:Glabrous enhancer-binding protein-like DBD domain-containing protein n=1 Tax=Xanthoceras sorbifolium TaxID=99658 RepID=A0ABQ8I5S1_9ROSI|nr:hypothetical protein JRO89_XS04G0172500 [Xanthoceras sorbifolium]